jgi:hypothetical protein
MSDQRRVLSDGDLGIWRTRSRSTRRSSKSSWMRSSVGGLSVREVSFPRGLL